MQQARSDGAAGQHQRAEDERDPGRVDLGAVRDRVVERMEGDHGVERFRAFVDEAEHEAQERENRDQVEGLRAREMDQPEHDTVDRRGGEDPEAGAKRTVEEPAEEELLPDRRDDDHHYPGEDHLGGALVGAEVLGHALLAIGGDELRVQNREGEERQQPDRRPSDRSPEPRPPQAEMPCLRALDAAREEDGRAAEDQSLQDRQREQQLRRHLVPDVSSRGGGDDAGDHRDDEGDRETPEEPSGREPHRPPRRGVGTVGELGRVGRRAAVRHRVGLRMRGQTGQITDGTSSRDESFATPGGDSAITPCRSRSATRMPAARAPSTSPCSESPTWNASPASHPACSRAARNTAGSGFAAPTTAEETAPSRYGASPARSSPSGSDASQLLAATARTPRSLSVRSSGNASGNARNRSAASIASRAVEWSRSSRASSRWISSAHRSRRSSTALMSRPSMWCAR